MYAMVPTTTPGRVRPWVSVRVASSAGAGAGASFANPKSASFAYPLLLIRMFAGLISMEDAGFVCGGQTVGDAQQQFDDLAPGAIPLAGPGSERAAFDEFR